MARELGHTVEVATLDIRPLHSVVLKHVTVREVISKWDVLQAHTGANSHTVAGFVDTMLEWMPLPIKVSQVDGASEFQDVFEEECGKRGIRLFVLPTS